MNRRQGWNSRELTPLEAAVLSETFEQLPTGLDKEERPILDLSLKVTPLGRSVSGSDGPSARSARSGRASGIGSNGYSRAPSRRSGWL
jgi:hypothetical protein